MMAKYAPEAGKKVHTLVPCGTGRGCSVKALSVSLSACTCQLHKRMSAPVQVSDRV